MRNSTEARSVVAVLEIGERPLVVGLGPLGGAVAAGERDGEEKGAEEGEAHGRNSGSRPLAAGRRMARTRGPGEGTARRDGARAGAEHSPKPGRQKPATG